MSTDPPWQTIPELVDHSAKRYAELEALVDGDVRLNYAEYGDRINESARAHMASSMQKGDRFSVWAPNIWEWPIAAIGGHKAGAVLIPINTRFRAREAAYVLRKSKAKILFTVTDFLDTDYVAMLRAAEEDLPDLREIVVLRGPVPEGCVAFADFLARESQVDDLDRADRSASVTGDDVCHILFTSGTTGAPKGAMLVHRAICKAYLAWSDVVGLREGDRYLIINPFFHAFGLNSGVLACIMKGACNLPQSVFDVPTVMRRVPEDRITMLPGPPAIFQTILNHPDLASFDMSTLRLCVTGSAAIPVEMIYAMREKLSFQTIVTGYGLTETSGIATMCRHDDDPETIARTSGRAIPDVEVRVVDPANNEVPRGEPGEIVVRGYNVMKGYLDEPEQTAETIDPDGWLHTGDIGVMDERGYIDITDRVKDMFIVGGFNAYPAEIENLMLRHPHIGQVAVVGVPDKRMGEVGMAFIVPRTGTHPDPAEIIAWCREEMANFKVPRYIEIVDSFPLNASGKVLKYELRARGEALHPG
ncbi:MAG TPA: FadD3 family acyl-CoA ligase [Acidimicrobiales bacterium]|jgi:acyl-CoA synthetase (AMP-forming)/AMP-acid ligase II|nr:FadD3 family acyl-CoA ligase [Acidimicrobiales bacterium]